MKNHIILLRLPLMAGSCEVLCDEGLSGATLFTSPYINNRDSQNNSRLYHCIKRDFAQQRKGNVSLSLQALPFIFRKFPLGK